MRFFQIREHPSSLAPGKTWLGNHLQPLTRSLRLKGHWGHVAWVHIGRAGVFTHSPEIRGTVSCKDFQYRSLWGIDHFQQKVQPELYQLQPLMSTPGFWIPAWRSLIWYGDTAPRELDPNTFNLLVCISFLRCENLAEDMSSNGRHSWA